MLRAVKNRFGTVNELGIFAMTETGLKGVSNPSAIFLSRHEQPVPGSVVTVAREGTRPMLIEVQALVDQSHLSNPRRLAVGYEPNRLVAYPVVQFVAGDREIDAVVFPIDGIRQSPASPVDGRPMRRADAAELESLLDEADSA